ncbi:EAL domain-containing protein [Lichenihabitans sp. Uapishka_5]|uniref:EAL domain-containing protein n=1 Tax=Lichenihabitans sp. Uapishka_5 TaxID=3037302 RepID=UPI0029E7D933|nr:EAL domain-containing protein [Lichenihabitans sp. Uapishka_5]MDX7953274.1 EAL domain-containing protein [Lichenihabitans sp. Uapishka_5]
MSRLTCDGCRDGTAFAMPFSMAFQPIVDVEAGRVYAHEALVRGVDGAGAGTVLAAVDAGNRYSFDQACRVRAIELAADLAMASEGAFLSINFLPNAVYEPSACIRLTLATAKRTNFPLDRLIFEFTENEKLDPDHVQRIVTTYKSMGFKTAIDDFGAGYAGLNLLARFQPDIIKLDMDLVRGIDASRSRRVVVKAVVEMCDDLGVAVLAEGIETPGEHRALCDLGIRLQQGYWFAKPSFEALAAVPADRLAASAHPIAA